MGVAVKFEFLCGGSILKSELKLELKANFDSTSVVNIPLFISKVEVLSLNCHVKRIKDYLTRRSSSKILTCI